MSPTEEGCEAEPQVEGFTGLRAASSAAEGPVSAPLGYYPHTGTLTVYRHGFRQRPAARPISICPISGLPIYGSRAAPKSRGKRGEIKGFSSEAALRLRSWLLTHHVEGAQLWDVTLTIPGDMTPEEWDLSKRRLFKRWERAGFGAVWRIELQKRKQPHLHVVLWTPPVSELGEKFLLIVHSWLECLPKKNREHVGATDHAIHYKGPYSDIEQSPKWLSYVAAHASKRKKEQLGWQGKQWGIINRAIFQERKPMVEVSMTFDEEKRFKRCLSRYLHARSKEHRTKLRKKGIKSRRRLRRMFFPSGCKTTRIMDPSVVTRMIAHVKSERCEIQTTERALNVPKVIGQAAARAAATEPPQESRHV